MAICWNVCKSYGGKSVLILSVTLSGTVISFICDYKHKTQTCDCEMCKGMWLGSAHACVVCTIQWDG